MSDKDLLFFNFPISVYEIHIIYAVLSFAHLVWQSRAEVAALDPLALRAIVGGPHGLFKSIFRLQFMIFVLFLFLFRMLFTSFLLHNLVSLYSYWQS